MNTQTTAQEFVSISDFVKRSSLSRATVYNLIGTGDLPRPVPLARRRVGLPADAVEAWFAARRTQAA